MARQYDKSADQLMAVIAAEPSNETAHFFLGFTREKPGLIQEAVNEFQRTTALSGGDPSYLAGFGHTLTHCPGIGIGRMQSMRRFASVLRSSMYLPMILSVSVCGTNRKPSAGWPERTTKTTPI